jgi:hypothetical protein
MCVVRCSLSLALARWIPDRQLALLALSGMTSENSLHGNQTKTGRPLAAPFP